MHAGSLWRGGYKRNAHAQIRRHTAFRYECLMERRERGGGGVVTASEAVHFRLRTSDQWFGSPTSLFWGSCLSSVIFCAASFILNIVWIIVRKLALWWINRKGGECATM